MSSFRLSRRAMLRGALGTAIGLPLLECMVDEKGVAYAAGSTVPLRYFLFYCPTSLVVSGSTREAMTPTRVGANFDVTPVLQPLADRGVTGDVSVVSGLFVSPVDGPGAYKDDHHGQAPFAVMSGVRSGWTAPTWRPQGWSADQIVAKEIGTTTRFPYLYYQIDPRTGGMPVCFEQTRGFSGEPALVYRTIDPQTSPTLAYRQLFAGFVPQGSKPDPQAELDLRLRKSSLSYAGDRIRALQARLGATDKRTLDEHLTKIRELELRLGSSVAASASCRDPKLPATDPANVSTDVPNQEARAALFVDLIEMAFACDLTRVITLGGTSEMTGSGMRSPLWANIGGLHGEVQHRGAQAELDAANRWFVDVYARVLARLKATTEGTTTVLDRTAALFVMEGGKGMTSDPQRSGDGGQDSNHSVDRSLMMVGGRAGGLKPGQHVSLLGRDLHHGTVFNAAYQALGVTARHGQITGVADKLFTPG